MNAPKRSLYITRMLPGGRLDPLYAYFDVRGNSPTPPPRGLLLGELADVEVLATTYLDPVDPALLAAAPRLRLVASYGVGFNHIDVAACRDRGVLVTNTPGVLTNATADMTMALLLAAARRVVEGDRVVRRGGWTELDPGWMLGTEITGKTLGIIGFGRIGQAVARRAAGFEMKILYADPATFDFPGAERVSIDELIARADFITVHTPLTDETKSLMSRDRIFAMKKGGVLINTARGGIIDDDALIEALAEGHLAAAGVDVFREEPRVPEAYLGLPNIVLTPHIGSGSTEARAAMAQLVFDDIERFARGEPLLNRVV